MTINLTDSDSRYQAGNTDDAHFEAIVQQLDGKLVRLDCEDDSVGRVYVAEHGV
jgi:hypothetical protein